MKSGKMFKIEASGKPLQRLCAVEVQEKRRR
jgi:hypothetical protein